MAWSKDEAAEAGMARADVMGAVMVAGLSAWSGALDAAPGESDGRRSIAAGEHHTCAVRRGEVYCWGWNRHGQLGDGTREDRNMPTAVVGIGEPVVEIAAGAEHTCAVTKSGKVACWGYDVNGQTGLAAVAGELQDQVKPGFVEGLPGAARALALGYLHSCAISGAQAYCWGRGDDGQLGDGSSARRRRPEAVHDVKAPVDLSAFDISTRAVMAQGTVQWWGQYEGEGSAKAPRKVTRLTEAVSQAARGNGEPCFVTKDGAAVCLGSRAKDVYRLSGSKTGAALKHVSAAATGGFARCAIAHDGELWCSRPAKGQRGEGKALRVWPVKIAKPESKSKARAGTKAKTKAAAKGEGRNAQLVRLSGVTAAAVGAEHACAIARDELWCWGGNGHGQLGVDAASAPADGRTPVRVRWP
jgi:hypothetical protein